MTDAKVLKSGNQLDVGFKEGLRKLGWSLTDEKLETIALVQVWFAYVCVCVCVFYEFVSVCMCIRECVYM